LRDARAALSMFGWSTTGRLTMTRLQHFVAAGVCAIYLLGFAAPASAEIPQVDGTRWAASTLAEKRAYMVGVANTVAVIRAIAAKRGTADANAANDRIDAALSVGTLNQAIDQIDQWYAANPSRTDVPVLGVVWLTLVNR
jgi:hypothetical protein